MDRFARLRRAPKAPRGRDRAVNTAQAPACTTAFSRTVRRATNAAERSGTGAAMRPPTF